MLPSCEGELVIACVEKQSTYWGLENWLAGTGWKSFCYSFKLFIDLKDIKVLPTQKIRKYRTKQRYKIMIAYFSLCLRTLLKRNLVFMLFSKYQYIKICVSGQTLQQHRKSKILETNDSRQTKSQGIHTMGLLARVLKRTRQMRHAGK